ncbi:MAG: hypothetical protein KDC18_12705 [Alphaproteobacteria bacterium]|nr:hypothetical protein [Alphaproteobacteria bacterium]MCB9928349.1 hypothetical protein [Alphaproteobacteria bacterium]
MADAHMGDESENVNEPADAERQYQASLTKGRDLIGDALAWYTDATANAPARDDRSVVLDVLGAGYKYFWMIRGDEVTVCIDRSSRTDHVLPQEISGYAAFDDFEDDQSWMYANTFNVRTGAFHASINYRTMDADFAKTDVYDPPLPNSTIIWFQKVIATHVYRKAHPDAEVSGRLQSISREQVGNTQTLATIFMADTDRTAFEGGTVTLTEPDEEAIALLGSPNGRSALFALMDHMPGNGAVDIASVSFTEDGLVITYVYA